MYLDRSNWLGLAAVCMWSTVAVGFKLGLQHMTPIQLLWMGACFSWLLFTACILLMPKPTFTFKLVGAALLLGLLNPVAYYVVLFTAYDLLPAHVAQPLNYTWAIVTALLAVPLLGQHLKRTTLIGIFIGYCGVVLLVTKGHFLQLPDFDILGVGLALLSTVLWAFYWLWSVKVRLPPWWIMWFGFTAALPVLTLLCVFLSGIPELTLLNLGFGAWIGWLEMGFAFLCWQHAMSITSSVAKLSQLIYLSPLISLVLIYSILNEPIHFTAAIALALVLGGLHLVNRQSIVDAAASNEKTN
ncbi:MAG: DMT family transporter [Gammaproteobacteria bacterium]|nr:DMT family transporter [Gammaproteobacteria bacterium]